MLTRRLLLNARPLSIIPSASRSRFMAAMPPSRSPSPPSKRTKLEQPVATNGFTSHALPSSSVVRPTSSELDKDASMLPVPQPASPAASTSAGNNVATSKPVKQKSKNKKKKKKPVESGGLEDIMFYEVKRLLPQETVETTVAAGQDYIEKFDHLQEVELEVVDMSSHGEGLALNDDKDWVVAVPFCVPGERVLARVYRNDRMHSYADLVKIVRRSQDTTEWRDDGRIQCKYFGTCSGCQYQMLSYEKQLQLKRNVVVKAYQNFSLLPESLVPEIGPTLPSPQQYGYRTKLTPHFDPPRPAMIENDGQGFNIGFQQKGRRIVMDIEECPIGTPAINKQMAIARAETKRNIAKFKRGATILLRDSLPLDVPIEDQVESGPHDDEEHVCITDHHAVVRERVAGKMFTFSANSFFQNNNGILRSLVEAIRDILPTDEADSYLVDAYCGSGLFAITLAERFKEVAGVEISSESIKYAKLNAEINSVKNVNFLAGSAEAIFEGLSFDARKTTILIDPPRKGCDEAFLKQLLSFSPKRIVYVSCNVHTQARDVGYIVKQSGEQYQLDSVRGCDLFPQTYHVEALAVLSRKQPF